MSAVARLSPRIGFLVDTLVYRYQARLFDGALTVARHRGASLVALAGSFFTGIPRQDRTFDGSFLYDLGAAPTFDGLIIASNVLATAIGAEALRAYCLRRSVPVVSVGPLPGFANVDLDDAEGFARVIEHLVVEHGRRRMAFVRGSSGNPDSALRESIFRRTLGELSIRVEEDLILPGAFVVVSGANAVRTLFDDRRVPPDGVDAIVAANDLMAIGVIHELNRRGLSVPADIAVVGFDDDDCSRSSMPPLTTVAQPVERIGAAAAQRLLDTLCGSTSDAGPPLRARPVFRSSCGCNADRAATPPAGMPTSVASVLAEARAAVLTHWGEDSKSMSATAVETVARVLEAQTEAEVDAALCGVDFALRAEAAAGHDLLRWESIGAAFLKAVRELERRSPDASAQLAGRLLRAERLIAWGAARFQANARLAIQQRAVATRALGTTLANVRTASALTIVLARGLPGVGARYTAVCDFVPETDRRRARLLAHYSADDSSGSERIETEVDLWSGIPATLPPGTRSTPPSEASMSESVAAEFDVADLLPLSADAPNSPADLLVYPLVFADVSLGYIVFDAPDNLGNVWVLESVARYVSSALYAIQKTKELRAARDAAQGASAAKSEFVAVMSHELRTPLTAILGHLSICMASDLGGVTGEHVRRAHASAVSLLGVVNDILDFSKIEARELAIADVELNLADVLDQVIATCGLGAIRKGLEFVVDLDPSLPAGLRGDPLHLSQVLTNLAGNAVKFTETGHVLVRAAATEASCDRCTVSFSVVDTGIGMSHEDQDRVFEPFIQADNSMARRFGGTGLGLSISRRLVEAMGGKLEVTSEVGKGSAFTFELSFATQGIATASDISSVHPLHVLVAIDCLPLREAVERTVHARGGTTRVARTATEAASTIRAAVEPRRFDVVIVDQRLREGDLGDNVSKAIVEIREPPALLVLGPTDDLAARSGEHARIHVAGVAKPFQGWHLAAALRRLHRARHSAPPAEGAATEAWLRLDGKRVLIAQDSDVVATALAQVLERAGAAVQLATDGQQAVRAATTGGFDLVLMDLNMPVLDGLGAARAIRADARQASLPILALTASTRSEDRDRCLAAGMNGFVPTPIDAHELLRIAREHIRVRRASGLWVFASRALSAPPKTEPKASIPQVPQAAYVMQSGTTLDRAAAMARLGGDKATYERLLVRFVEAHSASVTELRCAVESGDGETAIRLAHTLTSAAANLGATRLARAALGVESAIRAETPEGLADAIEELVAAHASAMSAIAFVGTQSSTDRHADTPPSPDVFEALRRMEEYVEQHDTAAVAALQELERTLPDTPNVCTALERIRSTVQSYDFAGARAQLEELREVLTYIESKRERTK